METTLSRLSQMGYSHPLKPSLVEWKRRLVDFASDAKSDLETFLGGMETPRLRRSANVTSETLKPSLVEWKLDSVAGGKILRPEP